jgi:hypothetical protein
MNYQQYLDERIHQLRIVCQSQWDYLTFSDVCNWLDDNFKNDVEGKYYATKILLHTVYYKKQDIENLLAYGLEEKIYGRMVKDELLTQENIYLSNSEALAKAEKLKETTFFVPLLDSNKPHESGNSVIGDLVHKQGVSPRQVAFHWDITKEKLAGDKLLIFVDDCVGSGNQLKRFWNSSAIQGIKRICEELGIRIYYLVLVGYENNLTVLKEENKLVGIDIAVCDVLTDKNRVFSNDNIIWDKGSNERERVVEYFKKVQNQRGINFLGFTKLDFSVILHDRLPNWSLPMFWKETTSWKSLLRRKTTFL